MERKMKLANLIKIETEALIECGIMGRENLYTEITRDANALADIVMGEKSDLYKIVLDLLVDGAIDFPPGTPAAQSFKKAVQVSWMNPRTSLKEQIRVHCDEHIENTIRMLS